MTKLNLVADLRLFCHTTYDSKLLTTELNLRIVE